MNLLEFMSSTIGHVAWPATTLSVIMLLRRPIAALIPKIRRAKWGDREVEFGERLEAVNDEIKQLPNIENDEKALLAPAIEELPASTPPTIVVLHNYSLVEKEVYALALAAGLKEAASNSTTRGVFHLLFEESVIDKATYDALMDLRRLRNVAAHKSNQQISSAEASEYAEAARTMRGRLIWIRKRLERSKR